MQSIALKYGFYMFIGFTAFFLLMDMMDLSYKLNLRILNGFIHMTFIYLAIKEFNAKFPELFNYLSGIAAGMWASFVGIVGFVIFQTIYLSIDEPLMSYIQQNTPIGQHMTPFTASMVLFMEGLVVSLLGSYFFMRIIDMRKEKG